MGTGRMTGRGLGRCSGAEYAGDRRPYTSYGQALNFGYDRGFGNGFGQGRGSGRGRRQRRGFGRNWRYRDNPYPATASDEIKILKADEGYLKRSLEDLQNRIEQLKKDSSE